MLPTSFPLSPHHALTASAVAAINHLLAREGWARDALMRHAGKVARIDLGHLALSLRVARDGMLEAAGPGDVSNVTIHVKPGDVPLILQQRDRAISYVRIEGDAEFANTLSQLSQGLRWDAEHDLERVVGPLAARRLVGGARDAIAGATTAGRRLAENVAEYLLDERPTLVRHAGIDTFAADVVRLRDDVERAAKRIARLEQQLNQTLSQKPAVTTVTPPETR